MGNETSSSPIMSNPNEHFVRKGNVLKPPYPEGLEVGQRKRRTRHLVHPDYIICERKYRTASVRLSREWPLGWGTDGNAWVVCGCTLCVFIFAHVSIQTTLIFIHACRSWFLLRAASVALRRAIGGCPECIPRPLGRCTPFGLFYFLVLV